MTIYDDVKELLRHIDLEEGKKTLAMMLVGSDKTASETIEDSIRDLNERIESPADLDDPIPEWSGEGRLLHDDGKLHLQYNTDNGDGDAIYLDELVYEAVISDLIEKYGREGIEYEK